MVLGADLHKSSHTIAAVDGSTGELLGGKTIEVGARGFAAALEWARRLGPERVWALEDCRHVSGSFERFLIGRGERVVRIAPRECSFRRCLIATTPRRQKNDRR